MSDKELKRLLKKWGAKQVESFWINSIIELTPQQRKLIDKEIENGKNNISKK